LQAGTPLAWGTDPHSAAPDCSSGSGGGGVEEEQVVDGEDCAAEDGDGCDGPAFLLPRAPFHAAGAADERVRALRVAIERHMGPALAARLHAQVCCAAAAAPACAAGCELQLDDGLRADMGRTLPGGASFVAIALMERLVFEESCMRAPIGSEPY
jgi:hypothetical protein